MYHEFGHVFGHVLCKYLGFNFGQLVEVKLWGRPHVKHDCQLFQRKDKYKVEDELMETERIKNNLHENIDRTICYIIYLLMGGVFNVRYFHIKPGRQQFEECYYNDYHSQVINDSIARAGGDMQNIQDFISDLGWNYDSYQTLSMLSGEIFYILDRYGTFIKLFNDDSFNEVFMSQNGDNIRDKNILTKLTDLCERYITDEVTSSIKNVVRKYKSVFS